MKILFFVSLLWSFSSLANPMVGQGKKAGCDPAQWTCDSNCQELKRKACGESGGEQRVIVDKSPASLSNRTGKKNVRGL